METHNERSLLVALLQNFILFICYCDCYAQRDSHIPGFHYCSLLRHTKSRDHVQGTDRNSFWLIPATLTQTLRALIPKKEQPAFHFDASCGREGYSLDVTFKLRSAGFEASGYFHNSFKADYLTRYNPDLIPPASREGCKPSEKTLAYIFDHKYFTSLLFSTAVLNYVEPRCQVTFDDEQFNAAVGLHRHRQYLYTHLGNSGPAVGPYFTNSHKAIWLRDRAPDFVPPPELNGTPHSDHRLAHAFNYHWQDNRIQGQYYCTIICPLITCPAQTSLETPGN